MRSGKDARPGAAATAARCPGQPPPGANAPNADVSPDARARPPSPAGRADQEPGGVEAGSSRKVQCPTSKCSPGRPGRRGCARRRSRARGSCGCAPPGPGPAGGRSRWRWCKRRSRDARTARTPFRPGTARPCPGWPAPDPPAGAVPGGLAQRLRVSGPAPCSCWPDRNGGRHQGFKSAPGTTPGRPLYYPRSPRSVAVRTGAGCVLVVDERLDQCDPAAQRRGQRRGCR
jgi:hypothetical protein